MAALYCTGRQGAWLGCNTMLNTIPVGRNMTYNHTATDHSLLHTDQRVQHYLAVFKQLLPSDSDAL